MCVPATPPHILMHYCTVCASARVRVRVRVSRRRLLSWTRFRWRCSECSSSFSSTTPPSEQDSSHAPSGTPPPRTAHIDCGVGCHAHSHWQLILGKKPDKLISIRCVASPPPFSWSSWDSLDSFTQHDVQELDRVLCDNIEQKMKVFLLYVARLCGGFAP